MTKKETILAALLLITIGIIGRILPHPWNMTPVAAVALFSGTYLSTRASIVVFFLTMFISDLVIGFYSLPIMFSVYFSFILVSLAGGYLRKERTLAKVSVSVIASTLVFFFITNLAVFIWSGMYSHTIEGIVECFTLALPFLKNQLLGDILYNGLLFGLYEYYLERKISSQRVLQRV